MKARRFVAEGCGASCVAIILGSVVATQIAAWFMAFHPSIGTPWGHVGRIPIYAPWSIISWYACHDQVRGITAAAISGCVASGLLISAWLSGTLLRRSQRTIADAWGTKADAVAAGILASPPIGTILGAWDRKRLLSYNGDEHQLVSGAAGSGKTTSAVIPTLLTWRESVLVYDPKRELFSQTAAFRKTLGDAFYFDPACPNSACFNPLNEIRVGTPHETGDIQNLVSILIDPGGSKNALEYWDSDAAKLLTGLILHVLHDYDIEKRTLGFVDELINTINSTLKRMESSNHERCRQIATYISGLPDKQRAGVYGSAAARLILFDDKLVVEKTSKSDFRISDLVCSDKPVTCYLQVRPTDAVRLRPLTRLILTQVAQALMYDVDISSDGREKRHRLLYLLEEFPSLGRLDFFSTQMRIMRGYGITALLVVQSFKDIINAYGRDQTIVDNCRIVVTFAASDPDTLRMVSTMVGQVAEMKESQSRPKHFGGWFKTTTSVTEHRRPLLEPGEVRQLGYDEQLVLVTGEKPFRTKKARWFDHPRLSKLGTNLRAGGVAPVQELGNAGMTTAPHENDCGGDDTYLMSLVSRMSLSIRQAAPAIFPGKSDRVRRMWISGEREMPDDVRAAVHKLRAADDGKRTGEELVKWITEALEQ